MRRLLESLMPGERPIAWKWIGSMFAFYVVVMAIAVVIFTSHHSRANLAHDAGGKSRAAPESRGLIHQLVHFSFQ